MQPNITAHLLVGAVFTPNLEVRVYKKICKVRVLVGW